MGLLIDGAWNDEWYDTRSSGGRFERTESTFRNWITADGSPGPSGEGGFRAEPGRYHLYIANVCPWAHRTLIYRRLKRLEDIVSLSVTAPAMGDEGWYFVDGEGFLPDPIMGAEHLHQLYTRADPAFTGRVTVPTLWDRKEDTIVNNESSEIIRMFNGAFDEWGDASLDLYPEALRTEIDAIGETVYGNVNNGVYKCGFATAQEPYEAAFEALFATLDELEARLGRQRYLVGGRITEADWRLFPTLVRFDAAYHTLFKCDRHRLVDYPNLSNYTRELYQVPGVAETVNIDHIRRGYAGIRRINAAGVVPRGIDIDFAAPHDRERLQAA